ncbi:MAG: hypothetical protein HY840_08460 [Bacteroidetes bacterium]|nr:hypothetical protein [Bacteroidota bacterium]
MNKNNIHNVLLSLSAFLFLILYTILSVGNRFHTDDYTLLAFTKEVGVLEAVIERYNDFCARWSADTFAFSLIGLYRFKIFLPLFHIVTLFSLILSFFLLIKKTLSFLSIEKIHFPALFLYTLLFTTSFYFASYNTAETWFWYVSACTYLWSIIAGNFLFRILLSDKFSPIHILLILLLTAYMAGAAESFTLIYILFLFFIIFLKRKNIFSLFTSKIRDKSVVVALIFLLLFYLITIVAPGTWNRKDFLTPATFIEHAIMVMKVYGKIILFQTPKLIPYLILFGLPWMLLGQKISSAEKIEAKKTLLPFTKSIFIIGALILVLILPASWVLYDLPPARALSQVSLFLAIYFSFIFFYIGYKINIAKKLSLVICLLGLALSVLALSFHNINQYTITSKFSKAFDNRIEYLLKENTSGRNTTMFLEPLPPSGMIYNDELSSDTLANTYFEKTYGLKFHLALRK